MEEQVRQETQQTAEQTAGYSGTYGAYQTSPELEQHRSSATVAMVLGILGDVLFFPPVINVAGLVLSILALVRANKNRRFALDYAITEDGKNIAGRWCGIAGIVLNALSILFWLFVIAVAVIAALIFAGQVGTNAFYVIEELF